MAITYPLALPDVPLLCKYFDFEIPGQEGATEGGSPIATDTGTAVFQADYETPPLVGTDLRLMTAWLNEAKKVHASVLAWDTRSRYPTYYQGIGWTGLTRAVGGAAFDGTCTLASVGSDGYTLGLSGLPAGFKIGPGDPLACNWNASSSPAKYSRAYHVVAPDGVITASGTGTMTISVNPIVKVGMVAGVTVYLDKPALFGHMPRKSVRSSRDNFGVMTFSFSIKQSHDRMP